MDPNLDDVYVNRDGTIRWNGDAIGTVAKVEVNSGFAIAGMMWRAEIGDAAKPEEWPPYRASYARTRKAAIWDVLADVEAPT
jgi:hypothetical protein